MTTYELEITTKRDLPTDVLVEHVAYALRGIVDPNKRRAHEGDVTVKVVNVKRPRQHPFEGPEVFDDEPRKHRFNEYTPHHTVDYRAPVTSITDPLSQVFRAIGDDFPHLAELFRDKRAQQPPAEGDWQLNDDDKVGDDV